jgi:hypothetical protein
MAFQVIVAAVKPLCGQGAPFSSPTAVWAFPPHTRWLIGFQEPAQDVFALSLGCDGPDDPDDEDEGKGGHWLRGPLLPLRACKFTYTEGESYFNPSITDPLVEKKGRPPR